MAANEKRETAHQWLLRHATYDAAECLIWPFSRVRDGYGDFGLGRRTLLAHRYMCELIHGPAPSPDHSAAHSCGRGFDGCVHPKHLSWKTSSENMLDKRRHGTAGWGPKRGKRRYKLTEADVAAIRAQPDAKADDLARDFGVSRANIQKIRKFKIWETGKYAAGGWSKRPTTSTV